MTPLPTYADLAALRNLPSQAIQSAILAPFDEGKTLKRVNAVLANYYDPDFDAETKALARAEFLTALKSFPDWAVQQAFDDWVKSGTRRPAPGEIVILVNRAMKPMADELARRAKEQTELREHKREAERAPVCKETAERIMQTNGFTVKRFGDMKKRPMANTWAEVDAVSDPAAAPPHWTEGKSPDDPQMVALLRARSKNPIMSIGMKKTQ